MKYGDTLRQRSIPEWAHYNVDYDYLKDLIKQNTTPGAGKALSIPGQGATTERAFSETFFKVLKAQHDRINLFIKSKSGEIERRLDYIGKQLAQLQARRPSAVANARLPARIVEKYAKIDADVTKAGEEIRSLSRFRAAQRTGFHKILKKYKRWTKDRELDYRFKKEVIGSPTSFFQLDLGFLLDQYIDVLSAVRAPLDNVGVSSSHADLHQPSSVAKLSKAVEEGSELDFDVALTSIPLGSHSSRATYWIHPDHIVEVEVLLLQYMRLHTSPNAKSATPNDSPLATPIRRKSSATVDKYFSNEDEVGFIVVDNPKSFALKQNSSTISSIEETPGTHPLKAAGNAMWTASGEAAVIVGVDAEDRKIARLKRKHLCTFLDSPEYSQNHVEPVSPGVKWQDSKDDVAGARSWLTEHADVKPIAGVCSKRTRFVGLHNGFSGGTWASLDRDIFMKDTLYQYAGSSESLIKAREECSTFPHAVLQIRREGNQLAGLIHILDHSHLVERVRGFSLETHAVWTCCKPDNMAMPTWVALLDKDIRKLPAPVKRQRRKAGSITDSSSHLSPPQTSTSATSAASPHPSRNGETSATSVSEFIDPPPLRAFRKKSRKSRAENVEPASPEAPPTQRYWNEYDNPESEDEGYYLYVDPNASVKMPGQELIEAWVRKTKKLFRMGQVEDEESPLASTVESSEDEETADEGPYAAIRNYGTITSDEPHGGYFSSLFQSMRNPARDAATLDSMRRQSVLERQSLLNEIHVRQHEREMSKVQLYLSCLGAGAVLDIILGVLASTSRRKKRGEVDGAVILGVICNLLLLLVAVASMKSRQERLGWIHQGSVFVMVLAMVAADALLFRWALNL